MPADYLSVFQRKILNELKDSKIDSLSNFARKLNTSNTPIYFNVIFLEKNGFLERLSEPKKRPHYFRISQKGIAALSLYSAIVPIPQKVTEVVENA